MSLAQIVPKLHFFLDGQTTEELNFGREYVTLGEPSDFIQATQQTETTIKQYGMSEKLGYVIY